MLREYNELIPGIAERIVCVFEKTATGQIDTSEKLATAEIEIARQGQALAFVLTVIALVASVYFFIRRDNVAGVAFLSVPVMMLIRSFIRPPGGEKGDVQ